MGHSTTLLLLDSIDAEAAFVLTQVWNDVIFVVVVVLAEARQDISC